MSVTILATADLHLGRRPTRLPNPEAAQRHACAKMWDNIVQIAIDRKVDVVALAGDIVESDNQYFEAFGRLERGLRRLSEFGIHTYAVSGNHDADVFPRILDLIGDEYFHLLGRNGQWESAHHRRDGTPVMQFHGWSFPARHVDRCPLDDYTLSLDPSVPTIGLLHADVDVSASRFAPVSSTQLLATHLHLWILGHIHQTQMFGGNKALYTGSPQAMDPGETGDHGPWLIESDDKGLLQFQHLVMSGVRYEGLSIRLDGVDTVADAQETVSRKIGEYLSTLTSSHDTPPEFAIVRVTLDGITPLCSRLDKLAREVIDDFERSLGATSVRVEQVIDQTQPPIDLEQMADRQDPTGVLAGILLKLTHREDDEDIRTLLNDTLQRMHSVHQHSTYADISTDALPGMEEARQQVLMQGMKLLQTLRAQEHPA